MKHPIKYDIKNDSEKQHIKEPLPLEIEAAASQFPLDILMHLLNWILAICDWLRDKITQKAKRQNQGLTSRQYITHLMDLGRKAYEDHQTTALPLKECALKYADHEISVECVLSHANDYKKKIQAHKKQMAREMKQAGISIRTISKTLRTNTTLVHRA